MTWWLAVLLKPVFAAIFLLVLVAPIVWVLYRVIPDGKMKFLLFKVRDGAHATQRDKVIMAFAGVSAMFLLLAFLMWLNTFVN